MVMEAPPSPQCVGREFVRQYYTLLNEDPTHLHRFYNNQSSFIHGSLDPLNRETVPVIGQLQIHQKIKQLNFKDCHAKITQVDSLATLDDGVVLQVTGELSNAGAPMRRFTQTFVLVMQSPKKYYVHNDIFRYQDEIVTDEEEDVESVKSDVANENTSEHLPESDQNLSGMNQVPQMGFYAPTAPPVTQLPPMLIKQQHHGQMNGQQLDDVIIQSQPPQVFSHGGQMAPSTSNMHPSMMQSSGVPNVAVSNTGSLTNGPSVASLHAPPGLGAIIQSAPPNAVSMGQNAVMAINQPSAPVVGAATSQGIFNVDELSQPEDLNGSSEQGKDAKDLVEVDVTSRELNTDSAPAVREPKTYANLLKGHNSGSSYVAKPYVSPPSSINRGDLNETTVAAAPVASVSSSNILDQSSNLRNSFPLPGANAGNYASNLRLQSGRNNRNGSTTRVSTGPQRQQESVRLSQGPGRNSFNEDTNNSNVFTDDRRRNSYLNNGSGAYGDHHQLFLGNVPHSATEDELRDIFSKFGRVVELRLHSKNQGKGIGVNARVPNYGFITYELSESVQTCLKARPIFYKDEKFGQHQLNVEEKKARAGGGGNSRTSSMSQDTVNENKGVINGNSNNTYSANNSRASTNSLNNGTANNSRQSFGGQTVGGGASSGINMRSGGSGLPPRGTNRNNNFNNRASGNNTDVTASNAPPRTNNAININRSFNRR